MLRQIIMQFEWSVEYCVVFIKLILSKHSMSHTKVPFISKVYFDNAVSSKENLKFTTMCTIQQKKKSVSTC